MSKPAILQECEDHVRPLGATIPLRQAAQMLQHEYVAPEASIKSGRTWGPCAVCGESKYDAIHERDAKGAQPHRFASLVEAKPIQHLVEFPVQVSGETAYRYEKVAQRRMREFVEHWLAGLRVETNGDALSLVEPAAKRSAGRELSMCEIALMAWAIRDYRIAQETAAKHRPGRVFAR